MNPLVVLHGALGSKKQLEPLCEKLRQKGLAVYSLNFSGHGGEPFRESFGIETFADDVLQFLEKQHLKQVDLFGYSMGGYVALWLACCAPEFVGRVITLGTKFDWSPQSAEKETRKLNVEKILEKVPAFARILEHRHAPTDWITLLRKTSSMMVNLGNQPLLSAEHFQTIKQPVTICLGDEDDMADRAYSEQVAAWLPLGKFMLLEKTRHPIEQVNLEMLASILHQA
ncbi:MAG: alpha/beta fold hydrolase [Cyclobacteriaceae bacterium]